MPLVSPQDVRSIMEMLEAVQRAEASGKAPVGSSDRYLGEMEAEFEYSGRPPGRSANEGFTGRIGNPDPVRAPWRGEYDMPGNFERSQHMADSMANDAMLRELLGSRRARTEADDVEGTFAAARYPGLEYAINVAASGSGPPGSTAGIFMSPQQARAYADERKRWAAKQRELVGMDRQIGRREWGGFRRGTKGMGAREKRQAFKRFLRG